MRQVTMMLTDGTKVEAAQDSAAGVLIKILRAHNSGNCGAYMGEAVLCQSFAIEASEVLRQNHAVVAPEQLRGKV